MKTKRMLLCAVAALSMLTGCGSDEDQSNQAAKPNQENSTQANPEQGAGQGNGANIEDAPGGEQGASSEALMAEFKKLADEAAEAKELTAYFDQHAAEVNEETADAMFTVLEQYYARDLQVSNDAFFQPGVQEAFADAGYVPAEEMAAKVNDSKVKALIETKLAGRYKLETSEGVYYLIVDYGALSNAYGDFLSADLRQYVRFKAMESDAKTMSDAAVVISWDELAARALAGEAYLQANKDGQRRTEVLQQYVNYMQLYVFGGDNTPIFDFETYKVTDEVKQSYEHTVSSHPDTVTASLIQQYLDILQRSEYRVFTPDGDGVKDVVEVQKFRDELQQKASDQLN